MSFARILLRKPKILVLDEATANIDSDTENKIKNAMDQAYKAYTIVRGVVEDDIDDAERKLNKLEEVK